MASTDSQQQQSQNSQKEPPPSTCRLERKSSKLRLAKQAEVEVAEESVHCTITRTTSGVVEVLESTEDPDHSAGFRTCAGEVEEIGGEVCQGNTCIDLKTSSGVAELVESEDQSPNSDGSDNTVVPTEKHVSLSSTPYHSPKDSSPEDKENVDTECKSTGSPTQVVNVKVRLVRSRAVCDDVSSPPPPDILPQPGSATLSVSPTILVRHVERQKLGHDNSQGSTVSDTSPALSRDSSFDAAYTDSTGTNLEEFIIKTLNKNRNDRSMLLHLETDMITFIRDTRQDKHKFPQMSSYHRMLVHRVAAFFGLEHNVDDSGKCVIVNRSQSTRIPEFKFRDHIFDELSHDDQPKKLILRRHRDCTSLEEGLGTDRVVIDDRKSKSFEEREEQYMEARNRIFQQQQSISPATTAEPSARPNTLNTDSVCSSKEDVRWNASDIRQWSSTDSSGYSTDGSSRLRVNVTKASSFHGVTVLTRGESNLSKTDSLCSGASNLNSPCNTYPVHNTESLSSSLAAASSSHMHSDIGHPSDSPFLSFTGEHGEPLAIWVASAIEQIPAGSFIINPQTGEPYVNADGSLYRWFPPVNMATEAASEAQRSVKLDHTQELNKSSDNEALTDITSSQYSLLSVTPVPSLSAPVQSSTVPSPGALPAPTPGLAPGLTAAPSVPIQFLCQAAPSYQLLTCHRHDIPTYRLASPAAGGPTTVQLLTLPDMTVQSVETYPAPVAPQPGSAESYQMAAHTGYVTQVVIPTDSSCDCTSETESGMTQLKLDVKSKGQQIFYTPAPPPPAAAAAGYSVPGYQLRPGEEVTECSSVPCAYYSRRHGPYLSPPPPTAVPYASPSTQYAQPSAQYITPPPTGQYITPPPGGQYVTPPPGSYVQQFTTSPTRSGQQTYDELYNHAQQTTVLISCPNAPVYRQSLPAAGSMPQSQCYQPAFHLQLPKQRLPTSVGGACCPPSLPQVYAPAGAQPSEPATVYQPWPSWTTKGCCGNVLQVCGLPAGLQCSHLDSCLSDLINVYGARRFDVISSNAAVVDSSCIDSCTVLAVFDSDATAHKALLAHPPAAAGSSNISSNGRYWLQTYHHTS